jgi:nucleotide-binding universal stress UspA family protein
MAEVRHGIVVGYDGSPGSQLALRWAVSEAQARGTPLRVCLAWAPHYLEALSEPAVDDLARQRGAEILAPGLRYAESLLGPDRVSPLLAHGSAAEVLCEQSGSAEMVVAGSHGHGRVAGLLLGSVAWELAGHGHGPVVIVRGQWQQPNQSAGPVVAGTDGSQDAQAAITFAFREAGLRATPLLAVCALADSPSVLGGARQMEEDFSAAMDRQVKEHPEVTVLRQVEAGPPRTALLAAAAGAQLLVVGFRGRGGFDGMRLGSVADAVLHHAPCPVAVIPVPAHGPGLPACQTGR